MGEVPLSHFMCGLRVEPDGDAMFVSESPNTYKTCLQLSNPGPDVVSYRLKSSWRQGVTAQNAKGIIQPNGCSQVQVTLRIEQETLEGPILHIKAKSENQSEEEQLSVRTRIDTTNKRPEEDEETLVAPPTGLSFPSYNFIPRQNYEKTSVPDDDTDWLIRDTLSLVFERMAEMVRQPNSQYNLEEELHSQTGVNHLVDLVVRKVQERINHSQGVDTPRASIEMSHTIVSV